MTRDELVGEARLRGREVRGRAEIVLLNRATRHRKSRLDHLITRAIGLVVPDVPKDPVDVRRGGLDRPVKRRDEAAFDSIVREG
ncbi:hypothetical protein [Paraconexibacter sp.]|uniref:hypothetical protein n=1 Tax=Paraconexibacter sp. TaxID=2949640 RepID=UPI00356549B7